MKILIITTYYPPDTAIAAVRPYMFAKHLSQMGHEVTVLRSGEIIGICDNFFEVIPEVRVISYLGENSPAELFARGQWKPAQKHLKSRIGFLPAKVRLPIARFYHRVIHSRKAASQMKHRNILLEKQKAVLDQLKAQEDSFDVVFSTYGELENIFTGQYASNLFGCKWIQDFRDSAAPSHILHRRILKIRKCIQADAICQADAVTAVSHGLLSELFADSGSSVPGVVLYNGHEPIREISDKPPVSFQDPNVLSLCYTGTLYNGKSDMLPILHALKSLSDQGKIDLSKVRIHYAGSSFDFLQVPAAKLHLQEILVNHGYVNRSESAHLQKDADIFVVLSWNTKSSQGILTGKFYEGIRAGKPILSVISGDVPHSELSLLNEKYHYGLCYESCRKKEQFSQLCDYLEKLYQEKMSTGRISYTPDPALETDFRYDMLAKKLEKLCFDVMG